MKIINFFGAPCAGKSTAASGLFNVMKKTGYKCEYVTEVAKDYIYDGSEHILGEQLLILAQQNHRVSRLKDKNIDFAITDAPILFSSFYASKDYPESFHSMCLDFFNMYDNINIFIHRSHEYNTLGRIHNESQSDLIAEKMINYLINNNIKYVDISAKAASPEIILSYIESLINPEDYRNKFNENNNK